MNAKCQTCKEELPGEFLVVVELLDEEANKIVVKKICQSCLEEFEQNDLEFEQSRIFEPKNLINPYLLNSGFNG